MQRPKAVYVKIHFLEARAATEHTGYAVGVHALQSSKAYFLKVRTVGKDIVGNNTISAESKAGAGIQEAPVYGPPPIFIIILTHLIQFVYCFYCFFQFFDNIFRYI